MKTAATFFSGIGGACHGLKLAGFEVIYGNDNWDFVEGIWRSQHPKAQFCNQDFLTIDPFTLPDADLFWFSPPCQNYSTANPNRRESLQDIQIISRIREIIWAKYPSLIVLENVKGYSKNPLLRNLVSFLQDFYEVTETVLNMADYGVPQNRYRYLLTAVADYSFAEPEKVRGSSWSDTLAIDDPNTYLKFQKKHVVKWGKVSNTITGAVCRARVYLCSDDRGEIRRLDNSEIAQLQTLNPDVDWGDNQKFSIAIGNAVPSTFVKNYIKTFP